MIHLSKRLSAIADLIPGSGGVADVGTDHGYIPVWLLQSGFEGHLAATDINAGPLARAKLTAAEHGVSDKISFHICDGLSDVNGGLIETVVIAGMGGENIAHILQNAAWTREKLIILQPMSKSGILREWLFENGFRVLTESLIRDGAVYEIISATGGTDAAYEAGETLTGRFSLISGDPLFPARLRELIAKTERAAAGLASSAAAGSGTRCDSLEKTLDGLRAMQSRSEGIDNRRND